MNDARTIRWGIIGCGNVTEVKSGPGFQKARGSELVAVMRRSADLAADYARRHNVPRWYDSVEALIADEQVDAVYIATPPGNHLEHALAACRAGKPAYVEKPMARSFQECHQMLEAFGAARLPLFVAYYRRCLPRFVKARDLVASGRLGTVTSVCYRLRSSQHRKIDPAALPWRLQAPHSGGGTFMDLGSHTLDILDFIFGPLKNAAGTAVNLTGQYDVEDAVAMHFSTESGAPGTASWNFAAVNSHDLIEIVGTEGHLQLSCFGNEPLRLETWDGLEEIDLPNPPHVQQPLIQTIVDELLGRGQCPSTGQSAARTALVMDRVLENYYGGRTGAFWHCPQDWPGRRCRQVKP